MFYGPEHLKLQKEFDCLKLGEKVVENIVSDEIDDFQKEYLESRDMFFLTTIDGNGQPTVSYKGGTSGLISVIDKNTIAFPFYDGNGMFLTAGNMVGNEKIGILVIDFETPFRLRLSGRAKRSMDTNLLAKYQEAIMVFTVTVDKIWINCNRYIHPHKRLNTSKYAPQAGKETPFPSWKRIEGITETLPFDQPEKARKLGDSITPEEWMGKIMEKDA